VRESAPNAAIVLDTQDLHSLRKEREKLSLQGLPIETIQKFIPGSDSNTTLREIASIHRSDHILLVSPFEKSLLQSFGILENKLSLAPFYYENVDKNKLLTWEQRQNFFVIGNFLHAPNKDQFKVT
jgi:ribosome recycling factor